jgi:hypothetical protein
MQSHHLLVMAQPNFKFGLQVIFEASRYPCINRAFSIEAAVNTSSWGHKAAIRAWTSCDFAI